MPLFSVLIRVYNEEKFLAESIASVFAQTCDEYEAVLVDDGSTDKSGAICDQYGAMYPGKVTVKHQGHQGGLIAMRTALAAANGEFIVWLDADDLLAPDTLETIKRTIQKHDCDMVIYNLTRISLAASQKVYRLPFCNETVFVGDDKMKLYRILLCEDTLNSMCMKAHRRSDSDVNVDYTIYKHVSRGDDYFQSFPIMHKAQKIVYLDKSLYTYRKKRGSITTASKPEDYEALRTRKIRTDEYIKLWNITDEKTLDRVKIRRITGILRIVQMSYSYERELCEKGMLERQIRLIADDGMLEELYDGIERHKLALADRVYCKLVCQRRAKTLRVFMWLISKASQIKRFVKRVCVL